MVGGIFETIANWVPFLHAVTLGENVLMGIFDQVLPDFIWVVGYAIVLTILAILLLTHRVKKIN